MQTAPSLRTAAPPFLLRALRVLFRLDPFWRGKGRIAFLPSVLAACRRQGGLCQSRLSSGESIVVPADDYLGRMVMLFGDSDPRMTRAVARLLHKGDCVIDVGANLGIFTLRAARLVGKDGAVLAIEPQPALAGLLAASLASNGFEHVEIATVALADKPGQLQLQVPQGNAGLASLGPAGPNTQSLSVAVETLDRLWRVKRRAPRLIKIDVEGFEAEVLAGAETLFEDSPPDFVLFEVKDDSGMPIKNWPAAAWLLQRGYRLASFRRDGRLRALSPDSPLPKRINDLLAIRESPQTSKPAFD